MAWTTRSLSSAQSIPMIVTPRWKSGCVEVPWWLDASPDSECWFRQRIFWARYDDEKGARRGLNPGDGQRLGVMVRLFGCEPVMSP